MTQKTADVTPFIEAQCQNLITLYALFANKPGTIAGKSDFPASFYKQAHAVKRRVHDTYDIALDYLAEQRAPQSTDFFFGRDTIDTKEYLELLAEMFDKFSHKQKKALDSMAKILVDEHRKVRHAAKAA